MKECEYCEKELVALTPPAEEYLEAKFCINIFGWKLMLFKDFIDYGCPDCIGDMTDSRRSEDLSDAVGYAIQKEIEKGNLIPRD